MFRRYFLEHPRSVGESYFQHMAVSAGFGWALLKASGACFVHALVPGLCTRTGSGIIRNLHGRMVTSRGTDPAGADDAMIWLAANI